MSCKYSNKKLETSREKESYALYTIVSTVAFVAFFTIAQWNLDSQLTNQHPLFQSEKKHKLLKCLTRHKNREQVLSIHKSCTILEVWAKKPDQKPTAYYQIYPWHIYDYYILCPLAKSVTVFVKITSLKATKTCL